MFWLAPHDYFSGDRVFVVGGGPSICDLDPEMIEGRPMVAVNNAGIDLFPRADVLFGADARWWRDNDTSAFGGAYTVTVQNAPGVLRMRHDRDTALSIRPDTVGGVDGGSMAINLAYLMGARDIVLVGFDMRPGNYHDGHAKRAVEADYVDRFIPAHERMAKALKGVRVRNATPGSAMRCYEMVKLEDVI